MLRTGPRFAARAGRRSLIPVKLKMEWDEGDVERVRAVPRVETGTRASRVVRRRDEMIPALIFGKAPEDKIPVALDRHPFDVLAEKRWFFNQTIDIDVEGVGPIRCVPKQRQTFNNNGKTRHISFLKWSPGQKLVFDVPIYFDNLELNEVVRRGGNISTNVFAIKCAWKGDANIPRFLYADLKHLKSNEHLRLADIDVPTGLEPAVDPAFKLAFCKGRFEANNAV